MQCSALPNMSRWFILCNLLCFTSYAIASPPLFLQAITSALATIPFTGGPMTMGAGLVGAKLAIGSKLLFYLGFFGRRKSRPNVTSSLNRNPGVSDKTFGRFPAVPLPYAFGGGNRVPQFGAGGFEAWPQEFQSGMFGGGYDPAQLFQVLASAGVDPMMALQAMGNAAGAAGFDRNAAQVPVYPSQSNPAPAGSPSSQGNGGFPEMPYDFSNSLSATDSPVQSGEGDDVDSFFTFLREMDDNSCVSRLVCDIGDNPSFLGEFSENINSIISSLEVSPASVAYHYFSILQTGKREGGCGQRFQQCTDNAYEIVKSVAPSVGVPGNVDLASIN